MNRFFLLSLVCVASPALAGHFEARPTVRPTQERFVARDNAWRCTEVLCSSARTAARPASVCSSLARAVGPLRSFTVAGQAFSSDQLAACNGGTAH